MARRPQLIFEFLARYEVSLLERVDHDSAPGGVFLFPDAVPVSQLHEYQTGLIVRVASAEGEPWIGIFRGSDDGFRSQMPPPYVIGWPDELSVCVVFEGLGCLVRADDPARNEEIESWPMVYDLRVIPGHELVVFAGMLDLVAYNAGGIAWRTERLVEDDLRIIGVEGDRLRCTGFVTGEFEVDVRTGGRRWK